MGGRNVNEADRAVAARVKAARVAAGLSQTQLAKALGITFQQVQKYERMSNRWSAGMLQLAADRLGVPAADFFDPPGPVQEPQPPTSAEARTLMQKAAAIFEEAVRREAAAMQVAA